MKHVCSDRDSMAAGHCGTCNAVMSGQKRCVWCKHPEGAHAPSGACSRQDKRSSTGLCRCRGLALVSPIERWHAQPCYCDSIETSSGFVQLPNPCAKHGPFECAEDLAIYEAAHTLDGAS